MVGGTEYWGQIGLLTSRPQRSSKMAMMTEFATSRVFAGGGRGRGRWWSRRRAGRSQSRSRFMGALTSTSSQLTRPYKARLTVLFPIQPLEAPVEPIAYHVWCGGRLRSDGRLNQSIDNIADGTTQAREAVFPTRQALGQMKSKLKGAQTGHDLLKRKSEALTKYGPSIRALRW